VEFGAHLPQIGWDDEPLTLDRILAVASAAERLGFGTITANDHLVYARPWLDGPSALAAVLTTAPTARLMTSVALPVVRGPFALAKTLGAIDLLSGGRVDAGLGPGSSEADYRLAGIPFGERWVRFDEAVAAIRALWTHDGQPFVGRFYRRAAVTATGSAVRAVHLDRQLGLGRRSAARRATGRRMARLRLQHHPDFVRGVDGVAPRHARGGGSGSD
jgi:alkanesulfonate monooxygenase SsuD/methylene tetrahydromethanopterin reductase-like flavin-dependent oxidoreductase (luciferase family)